MPGYATSITYHGNGTTARVRHSNNWEDVTVRDPHWLPRPASLRTGPVGTTVREFGPFLYDGSGNIRAIGADTYAYDEVSRLVKAVVHNGSTTTTQDFTYDRFGNLTSMTTNGVTIPYQHDLQTNRLTTSGYTYDTAGNLTAIPSATLEYDAFGMVTKSTNNGLNELYLYTPDDERLAVINQQTEPQQVRWTLRGLDMKVLRTYESELSERDGFHDWTWTQDYVYRGSSLLASVKPATGGGESTEHFHLDHLGTPRVKTGPTGILTERKYLPYGEELTNPALDSEVMQFTSHERDRDPHGHGNDLDYMHARFYSPRMGRFLSLDPILGSPAAPQSWNRYAYVEANPINFIDPYGLKGVCFEKPDEKSGAVHRSCVDVHEELTVVGQDPAKADEDIERSGVMAAAGAIAVALAADDATGIGVANDAAIPIVLAGAKLYDELTRTYITYVLENPTTGQLYYGRASGYGTPNQILRRRYSGHQARLRGFTNPQVDEAAQGPFGYGAIRGREQQLIDNLGGVGARDVGNLIRGVSRWNPAGRDYHFLSNLYFGPLAPYTGI